MSVTSQAAAKPEGPVAAVFANLTKDQQRGTASLMQAGEIASRTATAIWQKQKDFFQHEAVESLKGLSAFGAKKDPEAATASYLETLQNSVERAITDAREINDLLRGCAWQMAGLYAGLWPQMPNPTKPSKE